MEVLSKASSLHVVEMVALSEYSCGCEFHVLLILVHIKVSGSMFLTGDKSNRNSAAGMTSVTSVDRCHHSEMIKLTGALKRTFTEAAISTKRSLLQGERVSSRKQC